MSKIAITSFIIMLAGTVAIYIFERLREGITKKMLLCTLVQMCQLHALYVCGVLLNLNPKSHAHATFIPHK